MNRLFLWVILLISVMTVVSAEEDIYHYLEKLDVHHNVVVGLNGTSGDSLAASTIVVWLATEKKIDLDIVLESQVSARESNILVGHPCGNSLIPLSCKDWSYPQGVGIIRVMGEDLIVSGTTTDDISRAAHVITGYKKDYAFELRDFDFVLVREENGFIVVERAKKDYEFVCGDGFCETGEKCSSDCEETTCDDLCREKKFGNAACRPLPSNPSVPLCKENEKLQGLGYCATDYVCCCERLTEKQPVEEESDVEPPVVEEKLSLFQRFLRWLKRLFS